MHTEQSVHVLRSKIMIKPMLDMSHSHLPHFVSSGDAASFRLDRVLLFILE